MGNSTPSVKNSVGPYPASPDVSALVPDLDEWPDSWMVDKPDQAVGRAIVAVLRPLIAHLIDKGLSRRTLKRHVDNLWALGAEIITDINRDESLRSQSGNFSIAPCT